MTTNEELIAEARRQVGHIEDKSMRERLISDIADALEARQPREDDREVLAKQLRDIGAVRKVDQDCSCQDCEGAAEWVNAPLSVVLDHFKTNVSDAEPTHLVCAWCPQPARGDAWHNDGKLHPSCGQIDHGQGWVPPYTPRAAVPDAAPTLCVECNEVEVLGKPEHRVLCMDCAYETGRAAVPDAAGVDAVLNRLDELNNGGISYEVYSELHDLVSAIPAAVPDAATELARAEEEIKRLHGIESLYMGENERAIVAEAERDAALEAIERVRAIHVRHKDTHKPDPSVINGNWFCCGAVQLGAVDPYACIACDSPEWPCPTIAALDGAPEPEVRP